MPEPTPKGIEKYPPNGYYDEEDREKYYPCTCKPDCAFSCKGDCGCSACRAAYYDAIEYD